MALSSGPTQLGRSIWIWTDREVSPNFESVPGSILGINLSGFYKELVMVCESVTRVFSFMGKIPGMIAKDKDHQYPLTLLSLQEVFPHQELELSLFFYCPKSTCSHSFPYFQSTLTGNEIFCPKPWVQGKRIFITCKDIYLSLSKWTTVWGGSNHCIQCFRDPVRSMDRSGR